MTSLQRFVRRYQLLSFFVLTYAIMFGVTFASVFWPELFPYHPIVLFVGAFSPTAGALIVSGLIGGMPAIKQNLVGFTRWKVGARWYLATISLFLAPLAIALVYQALGNPAPGLKPGVTAAALFGQVIFTVFSGPASEEAGWRGFALPRLQARYNALVSSLILGVIWTCWHIPLYFIPGSSQRGIPFPAYLMMVVGIGILISWLYNNTRGSLIITVLAHFSFNMVGAFITGTLGMMPMNIFFMTVVPGLVLWVIAVILIFGPRYLSKKPVRDLPFTPPSAQEQVRPEAAAA